MDSVVTVTIAIMKKNIFSINISCYIFHFFLNIPRYIEPVEMDCALLSY